MTRHPRLRAPAVMAIGGSVIAAAVVIGQGWAAAAPVEAVTIAAAIGYYVLGGRGGDLGAIIGHRADQRQESIRVRARALAAQVAGLAAVAGYVIELARGSAPSGRLSSSPPSSPGLSLLDW